jgi:hypothetical protein
MRQNDGDILPRQQYNSLLFARAFNRIGWSNKLLKGIPWKNYVVYPPADIISMLEMAKTDLKQVLSFEELPVAKGGGKKDKLFNAGTSPYYITFDTYYKKILNRYARLEPESIEYKTHQLLNFESDFQVLAKIVSKRYYFQAFKVIEFIDKAKTQTILAAAGNRYTLEEILSKKNRELFSTMGQVVQMIGINR